MWRLHVSPSFHHFLIPPPSPRLPQRVSERLVEGALVRGSRWKPVPAEGPWRPAAAGHCGATERCRGGDGRPRPQASLLLLHPAVRQRTRFSRGTILSSCLQLGWFCWVISDVWKEMRQKVNVHGDDTPTFLWKPSNVCVCVFPCTSGQLLGGSGPLAGCAVCRDRQHHSPWRAPLWLHRRGHAHWHTARSQKLLPVSHFLRNMFVCFCVCSSGLLCLLSRRLSWNASVSASLFFPLRWATTTAASSSSASTDSRTYDDVYESVVRKHNVNHW